MMVALLSSVRRCQISIQTTFSKMCFALNIFNSVNGSISIAHRVLDCHPPRRDILQYRQSKFIPSCTGVGLLFFSKMRFLLPM